MRKVTIPLLAVIALSLVFIASLNQPNAAIAQEEATPGADLRIAALETRVAVVEESHSGLATRVAVLEATKSPSPRGLGRATPVLPTPTPKLEGPALEILSIDSRVTEDNNVWAKFAWILEVVNHTDEALAFNAEIQFQDADGFVVDTAYAWGLVLGAGETDKFSDAILITMPAATTVENISAQIQLAD